MRNTGSNTLDHQNIFTMKSKNTKSCVSKNQNDSIYLGTLNESPRGIKITAAVSTDRLSKKQNDEKKDQIITDL